MTALGAGGPGAPGAGPSRRAEGPGVGRAAGLRVALDIHALQVAGYADRGVGRYVAGYSRALWRRRLLDAALLAPELPPATGIPPELLVDGSVRWDTADGARRLLRAGPGLVYHATAPFLHCEPGGPYALGEVEHWARAGVRRAVLLHDLIPLRAPSHYLSSPAHAERYRRRAAWVRSSDLVLTNSEYTRGEAIEILRCPPERVVVAGAGVSPFFAPHDGTDTELWDFHFPALAGRPHLLTVGGSDERKGIIQAIIATSLLIARGYDVSLVVVGHLTAEWHRRLGDVAAAAGVADRVILAGAVDDDLLRACYRRATLTVMPSLAEGAGLPVLESAACGTPALASGTTALAEMAASPMAVFDPSDADSIAVAVAAVLDDPARREGILDAQRALAARSTWNAVVERAEAAMATLVTPAPAGRPAVAAPPRVALVGWPDNLGRAVEAAMTPAVVTIVGAGGAALSALGVELRPAGFDLVVYAIGPDTGSEVYDLAGRYPGWLWVRGPVPVSTLGPLVVRSSGIGVQDGPARAALDLALRAIGVRRPIQALPPVCPPVGSVSGPVGSAAVGAAGAWATFGPGTAESRAVLADAATIAGRDLVTRQEGAAPLAVGGPCAGGGPVAVVVALERQPGGFLGDGLAGALSAGVPVVATSRAAAGLPPEVVERATELQPQTLAAQVESLLRDPARLDSHVKAGMAFAGAHGYANLGRRLLALLD